MNATKHNDDKQAEQTIITAQGNEWTGPEAEAFRAGIERLGAVELEDGSYAYLAEETSSWYSITADDVAELGAAILLGEDDAYSHWCAATGEEISDLNHDALDAVQAHCSEGSVEYRCQCGRWSGERCMWTGPRAELVHVKFVQDSDQGSAKASGTYTHGAYAKSIYVSPECAEMMRYRWEDGEQTQEEDEFVRVVGPAYDSEPPERQAADALTKEQEGVRAATETSTLTVEAIVAAMSGDAWWLEPESDAARVVEQALAASYLKRLSHTQIQWTDDGLAKARVELGLIKAAIAKAEGREP